MKISDIKAKKLDRMVQELHKTQLCRNCYRQAEVIHHYLRRRNRLFRWNLMNLLPLCTECHNKVHAGILKEESFMNPLVKQHLDESKNKTLKDYLQEIKKSEEDYLKECEENIRKYL